VDAVTQILNAPPQPIHLRDGAWLRDELAYLWRHHFGDVPQVNRVEVRFGGSWKTRLGVISLSADGQTSSIGINGLLSLPEAPYYIARITVAHEMVHYAHGFGSPLPRKYRHPHRGRIVEKELRARGLSTEFETYQSWIHEHWFDFFDRVALNSLAVPQRGAPGPFRETYESQ
jgi:hypothetical protein